MSNLDPVLELKVRAERLHRAMEKGVPTVFPRLRLLPELRKADDVAVRAWAMEAKRKHGLAVVALEAGFRSWEHALRVIDASEASASAADVAVDFGDLLYPKASSRYLNHWFSTYAEAREHRDAHGGYLFGYRHHCFVVAREFVESSLGVDPDDEDWKAIGWDWIVPKDLAARRRLYARILTSERRYGVRTT